jgi:UTP:GlnB (protein PII) uridylyltransferase
MNWKAGSSPRPWSQIFEAMSSRYLLERKPKEIVRHILEVGRLRDSFKAQPMEAFSLDERESFPQGTYEVTFLGQDRPGLFADLAGVMALNNINILSAHIYTWRDGTSWMFSRSHSPSTPCASVKSGTRSKKICKEPSPAPRLSRAVERKSGTLPHFP